LGQVIKEEALFRFYPGIVHRHHMMLALYSFRLGMGEMVEMYQSSGDTQQRSQVVALAYWQDTVKKPQVAA
jgi:hypothetical protein